VYTYILSEAWWVCKVDRYSIIL